MSKDTYWFSHDYNARTDGKLLKLRMKHGMEGIGVYWCIVEMLYEENGFISLQDYERITFELRTNEELVRTVINDFGLFEVNCERFWSNSALERLAVRKDKSEQARAAINVRWEMERKRKSLENSIVNTDVLPPNNERNTIKDSIDSKEEETKGEAVIENLEKKEDMVVAEMYKIWMKHKPRYAKELEKDSHCLLALAYKIQEYKGWKRSEVVGAREKDILSSWEKIVKYVVADQWYSTKSLTIVNSQWQSLVEQMDAAKNGTTVKKTEPPVKIVLK